MSVEAQMVREEDFTQFTAAGDYSGGEIIQLPDGRPAVVGGLNARTSGDEVVAYTEGEFDVVSDSATVFARGDKVFWDASANVAITAPGDILSGIACSARANSTWRSGQPGCSRRKRAISSNEAPPFLSVR